MILAGLEDHWGSIDPALNPDLEDIAATYADGVTLVAWMDGRAVGTGTLVANEIVRMAVARAHRRQGIGRAILLALLDRARERGASRVTLETTATWLDTVAFYEALGFRITHVQRGRFGDDLYFALDL